MVYRTLGVVTQQQASRKSCLLRQHRSDESVLVSTSLGSAENSKLNENMNKNDKIKTKYDKHENIREEMPATIKITRMDMENLKFGISYKRINSYQ